MMDDSYIKNISSLDMRNIVLKSSLPNNDFAFNICHLNPGSLVANFDEFKLIMKDIHFHAIAVSETWFKTKHSNQCYQLDGFTLLRKDRTGRRSGGVAIYVRKKLNPKIVYKNGNNSQFDVIFIEIGNHYNKLVIGVIYCPPKIEFTNDLEIILDNIMAKFREVIIVGDFNRNCLSTKPKVIKFKSLMSSFGLNLISKEATNFMGKATLIDLVFANIPANFNTFTQISVPGIATTHDMIYGSYAFYTGNCKENSKFKFVRNFRNINWDALLLAASPLDWNSLYSFCDVNDQLSIFNAFLLNLLNIFAPLRKHLVKRQCTEINFSNEILRYRNIRDFLHENWKRNKTDFNRLEFIRARNKVNNMIRSTKRKFFNDRFNKNIPCKLFWKNFRAYIQTPGADSKSNITSEEFNEYFGSVFLANDSKLNLDALQYSSVNTFYFRNVSNDEVSFHFDSIKSGSAGADGIPLIFIKLLKPIILPHLTYLINSALTKSVFPDLWKIAVVTPIPKTRAPVTVNDFRPISILPVLSKLFERIIQQQINDHLLKYNLLNNYQSGFRANHSTTTALLKVVDDITSYIEDGKLGILVLLDFSKAFDKVDHITLVMKLCKEYNFSKCACQLVFSYLHLRQQSVKYYDNFSKTTCITSGVPQGSILGPLLFSLYINELCTVVQQSNNTNCHLYADDLQLYSFGEFEFVDNVVHNLNITLSKVLDWSTANKLQINPSKSQAIIFSNKKQVIIPSIHLVIDNQRIDFFDQVKSLGLFIDNKLNWSVHVNNLCSKIYGILSKLWSTAIYISSDVKCHIIRTLVGPLLSYCAPIYLNCSKKSLKRLNVAFNACARYIFLKRIGEPISVLSKQIFNMSLNKYLELSALCLMFNLIQKRTPSYLYENLNFGKSRRTFNLNLPKSCKSKPRHRSFFVHGVKLWNNVHPSAKAASTLCNFKKLYDETSNMN